MPYIYVYVYICVYIYNIIFMGNKEGLASFTHNNYLEIHPLIKSLFLFNYWIEFHGIDVSKYIYIFTYWWTLGLILVWNYGHWFITLYIRTEWLDHMIDEVFKSGSVRPQVLSLFSKVLLDNLGIFNIYMNFRISLSIFTNIHTRILIVICTNFLGLQ